LLKLSPLEGPIDKIRSVLILLVENARSKLSKQPVQIFASPLSHQVGNELIGEAVGQFGEEIAHFFFHRRRGTVGRMAKKGNRLLFGAELALVADESFLVDVA